MANKSNTATPLRPTELRMALIANYENPITRKHAIMIMGPAGIGKSQIVAQVAEHFNVPFIDVRLSQMDPTDLRGVPSTHEGVTLWNRPSFLPDCTKHPVGIFFLDEINAAPPSVSAAAYQLILDRKLGDYQLGDGWMIVAAGNNQSDRGVTFTMPAPLANRFTLFQTAPNLVDFLSWAMANKVDEQILSFLKMRPEFLHQFDGTKYTSGEQFATPRGWERLSHHKLLTLPEAVMLKFWEGDVGVLAATEFLTFLKFYDGLISFEEILSDPAHAAIPGEMGRKYAVVMMIAGRMDKFNADTLYTYLKRLPREFAVLTITLAYQRDAKQIARTQMFGDFSDEMMDLLKQG
jgi:hypothetical protein